jgi:hypothetical protein
MNLLSPLRLAAFPVLLLLISPLAAQKEQRSEGAYLLNLTRSTLSEAEACQECIRLAMIEAIEKAYGRVLVQGNTTYLQNRQTGESVETRQQFNLMAETYVNGEWIKTLDESCERQLENGEFWLKCEVRGLVQELRRAPFELQAQALDCPDPRCATPEFQDGEPLYAYVKSPEEGYLAIYLSDPEETQRLFPYRRMPAESSEGGKLRADQGYLLFSRSQDRLGLSAYVDEYEMFTEQETELSRVYFIFSKKPLDKPLLNEARDQAGYDMPMNLPTADFQQWLARQRQHRDDVVVQRLDLLVRK